MIVPDANLLLFAYDTDSPFHKRAYRWLHESVSGPEVIGFPWLSIWAFLRIVTNLKLPGRYNAEEATQIVADLLAQPNVTVLTPGERHFDLLRQMMVEGQAHGPMVTDAQLAAITLEHGGVLYTNDRDFARFPRLRWKNPLQ